MRAGQIFTTFLLAFGVAVLTTAGLARAADSDATETAALKQIQSEMRQMRAERKRDREVIRSLEMKVQQLESKDSRVETTTQQLQNTDQKLKETTLELQQTNEQVKTLQTKVDAPLESREFGSAVEQYLGSHSFTVTGAAGGQFIYDGQNSSIDGFHAASQNSFFFDWEPMILYRPNDWMLFQGVFSAGFGANGTGTDLSTADFQIFLNKYMTVVAGLFDNPFGDWYEDQSPMATGSSPRHCRTESRPWFREASLEIQLRGGMQVGALGQDFDYTIWPKRPELQLRRSWGRGRGPTSIASSQSNGKSIAARFPAPPAAG